MNLRLLLVAALAFFATNASAQLGTALPTRASDWHLLDATADAVPGVSAAQAHELLAGRTPTPVVVAIIDSGVDITHPDLASVLWTNPGEIAGNGTDDDGNGYADDMHGWSYLGGPGGNVEHERGEIARMVAACRVGGSPDGYVCEDLETELQEERAGLEEQSAQMGQIFELVRDADTFLKKRFGDEYDPSDASRISVNVSSLDVGTDPAAARAVSIVGMMAAQGAKPSDLAEFEDYIKNRLAYFLNPDYDPRPMVGDDPDNAEQTDYGVPDVTGPDAGHGTGVAGLVAAVRGNGIGIDGLAPAQIMALRTVPDGDERDKDVANAIRYAVDNGARIINMSFGKDISPRQDVVEAAALYAAERGVLLVHASGNDGADIEEADNFPTPYTMDGGRVPSWLEVGASTDDTGSLAATFSNYGQSRVDLFAPGGQVTSLAPGGGVQTADGTSFASPVVAGVAALVMAYFPDFSAEEVRQILMDSAIRYTSDTALPGGEGDFVPFTQLSSTGGVVNAAAAVRLAIERSR